MTLATPQAHSAEHEQPWWSRSDDRPTDHDASLPRPTTLTVPWLIAGIAAAAAAAVVSLAVGPVGINPWRVVLELVDHLPLVTIDSGLSDAQAAIVWQLRAPRMLLGLTVGALLAGSGAAYQGVFRNPLADPYLLGIAAGAGLGATVAIVGDFGDGNGVLDAVPMFAFIGALVAVGAAGLVSGRRGFGTSTATLVLSGVAVASFFTALQTYVLQIRSESLRQVYSWILGRLTTSSWDDVLVIVPYAVVCIGVLLWFRGALDVLAVGDAEAKSLGVRPNRVRAVVLLAASLGAAAAVAFSGLIGFVGLIVPHAVRAVAGASYRRVIPLSLLFGAAFLTLADVVARTVQAPAELPIGVITAFVGAPFFLAILRKGTA